MTSVKNLSAIFGKIVEGAPPDKFTATHLKSLGFKSSNDVGVLALLKDLGFLTGDGTPTERYHLYRDRSQSRAVMGQVLKDAYGDVFHVNERPTENDRKAIEGKFKSTHGSTDRVAREQTSTFFALLKLADLDGAAAKSKHQTPKKPEPEPQKARPEPQAAQDTEVVEQTRPTTPFSGFRYNIEIHLPASKDPEVYNAIFKSLKEHLFDD